MVGSKAIWELLLLSASGLQSQMDQTELLFALLNAGQIEDVKKLDPECIDWSRHSKEGHTIIVKCMNNLLQVEKDLHDQVFDCIKLCINWGASPGQKCTEFARAVCRLEDRNTTLFSVALANLSAVSYVETAMDQLRENSMNYLENESLYSDIVELGTAFSRALSCFATAVPSGKAARVSIHQGIAELWERYLAAKASHDLSFKAADGEVTAHAQMLKEASPVISAMLASTMKEAQARTIEVKDTSSSSISFFLEILYTCSAQTKPDYTTALQALDLAHRWQVQVVVTILSDLLGGMITDESFVAIAEQAVLKGLESLKRAAQSFGATSAAVQAQLKDGRLPAAVMQLFPSSSSSSSEPASKRMRL